MHAQRYIFVGDKFTVLNRMQQLGLNIMGGYCAPDFFENEPLYDDSLPLIPVQDKEMLLKYLEAVPFDILVSNGCPHILPVSEIKKPEQRFVNIHASRLPLFHGPHPVNGAMLYGEDGGATCHLMDDGVDTGAIVSQVSIPYTTDLDAGLLYMMTNRAEADVFEEAYRRDFEPMAEQKDFSVTPEIEYFKRTDEVMEIDFSRAAEDIVRHVRAFSLMSQGAWFSHKGHRFTVLDAEIVNNPYLCEKYPDCQENQILFVYDNTLVVRKDGLYVKLKQVSTQKGHIQAGEIVGVSV